MFIINVREFLDGFFDCERTINTYHKLNTYYAKFFNASEFVYILQKSLKGT